MPYQLSIPNERIRKAANGWLMLGLAALIGSGLFALLLVLARTPGVQEVIPGIDLFHTALVVHVDLSVLIWFVAFAGVLWTLNCEDRFYGGQRAGLYLAIAGTVVITVAPFAGAGDPLMNNYIPVLQHPLFYFGLLLFGVGMLCQVVVTVIGGFPARNGDAEVLALKTGNYTAALAALVTLVVLAWTWATIPEGYAGRAYFETLFWGGGHVLQFTYTQAMLVAWLWLASATALRIPLSPRAVLIFIILGFLPVLAVPAMMALKPVGTGEHVAFFSRLMKEGNGLSSIPIGLAILVALFRGAGTKELEPEQRPLRAALNASLALFAVGGILGFMITEVNTVIPAHYHGSIVGVTLAFMGLSYLLLPRLGYTAPVGKLAISQPYVYAVGQFLHIAGLAWSGFYGVQRKTAGAAQELDRMPEIAAMLLFGLGGLISIVGGILFLVVALRAILKKP